MLKFKILQESKRLCSKLATLDFTSTDCELSREMLGRVTWDKALKERGAQESQSIINNHPLQDQKQCILRNRKTSKNTKRPQWINKELPDLRVLKKKNL